MIGSTTECVGSCTKQQQPEEDNKKKKKTPTNTRKEGEKWPGTKTLKDQR